MLREQIVSELQDQMLDLVAQMYHQTMLSHKFVIDEPYTFEDPTIWFTVRDLGDVEYYLRVEFSSVDTIFTIMDASTGDIYVKEDLRACYQHWFKPQPDTVAPMYVCTECSKKIPSHQCMVDEGELGQKTYVICNDCMPNTEIPGENGEWME